MIVKTLVYSPTDHIDMIDKENKNEQNINKKQKNEYNFVNIKTGICYKRSQLKWYYVQFSLQRLGCNCFISQKTVRCNYK